VSTGRTTYVPQVPFILLGPLTWMAGLAHDSVEVLVFLRMPFVVLMWVNALLMVKAAVPVTTLVRPLDSVSVPPVTLTVVSVRPAPHVTLASPSLFCR